MIASRLTPRFLYAAALGVSVFTLGAVLAMQYGFGLKPCELCTFQRIPYAIAIVVSLLGLALRPRCHNLLLAVFVVLFAASVGLGIYHAGVEKKIFEGPNACTSSGDSANMTIEQLREKIMAAPIMMCDQPQWEWHGVTLAVLNVFWSLGLFTFFTYGFFINRSKHVRA